VGRVIFANFLKLPLERYKNTIKEVEGSTLFKKLSGDGDKIAENPFLRQNDKNEVFRQSWGTYPDKSSIIIVKHLSKTKIPCEKINKSSEIVAAVVKAAKGFSIRYVYEGFNKTYTVCGTPSPKLFYKLRRISSRNELTHRIILGIIEHQKKFLSTDDSIDLAPFSQVDLAKWLNGNKSPKIDISWISRLVNRLSVILPSGEERILKSFFPTQRDVNKRLIKQILDQENEDIDSGRIKGPLTDSQIRARLESKYRVKLSRHSIALCRKDMGIPPAKRRFSGYKYPPLSVNFSLLYPLTVESVQSNAPASPGVYEFRLKGKEIEYLNSRTAVIYIGSAKNLKKRLKEHLRANNRNGHIRHFLKKFDCSFRYIQFLKNWGAEEGRLYNLFVITYGAPPKCNRIRPYGDEKKERSVGFTAKVS